MQPSANPSPAKKDKSAARIIRTFEEVQVPVVVEEWYQELDCAICSHIMGATQAYAVVPCSHSFCGPCAWRWVKLNSRPTCPTCRVELSTATPMVPNITLEQVIEHKLQRLIDSDEKEAMILERKEQLKKWKAIQATISPPRRSTRTPRGLDDIMNNLIDFNSAEAVQARRASRHVFELGAPVDLGVPAPRVDVDDDELLRAYSNTPSRVQELHAFRARLRERQQRNVADFLQSAQVAGEAGAGAGTGAASTGGASGAHDSVRRRRSLPPAPALPTMQEEARQTPDSHRSHVRPTSGQFVLSSQAFARRQARGRADGGTREDPQIIHSDSE
ncbi:hypothetical protein IAT38_003651 [Cryptococcus sp. DSM 104549]